MSAFKRLGKSRFVAGMATALAAAYIRFVHRTTRWEHVGTAVLDPKALKGRPVIATFWHGRLLMLPALWPREAPVSILISRHRDGEFIANTMARFGFDATRGSSPKPGKDKDKGGQAALMALIRTLRSGKCTAFTPDGPRGPRMRASLGIAVLARLSGAPVVPMAFSTRRRRVLGSWDRFVLALPFTRGVYICGEPIHVASDADGARLEAARLHIEQALNAVTREADRLTGHAHDAVEPAPLETPRTVQA